MGLRSDIVVRPGRMGAQFDRTFSLLSYVSDGWCNYKETREREGRLEDGEPEGPRIRAIFFDKLVTFLGRVWDAAYDRTGKLLEPRLKSLQLQEHEVDGAVMFPLPIAEMRGTHGRGRAVLPNEGDEGPPRFILETLYRLQEEGIYHDLVIRPPEEAPGVANDYRTTVEPGLIIGDQAEFLIDAGFTRLEREFAAQLEVALRRLPPSQLRVLGTHDSRRELWADIDKEFELMMRHLPALGDVLLKVEDGAGHCQSALVCAEEARRKAEANKGPYSLARAAVLAELRGPLKKIVEDVQRPADEIWDETDDLRVRRTIVRRSLGMLLCIASQLLQAKLIWNASQLGVKEERRCIRLWEEGRRHLGHAPWLPPKVRDCFAKASKEVARPPLLVGAVADGLGELLASVMDDMKGMLRRA